MTLYGLFKRTLDGSRNVRCVKINRFCGVRIHHLPVLPDKENQSEASWIRASPDSHNPFVGDDGIVAVDLLKRCPLSTDRAPQSHYRIWTLRLRNVYFNVHNFSTDFLASRRASGSPQHSNAKTRGNNLSPSPVLRRITGVNMSIASGSLNLLTKDIRVVGSFVLRKR